jgi:hypothetical protein
MTPAHIIAEKTYDTPDGPLTITIATASNGAEVTTFSGDAAFTLPRSQQTKLERQLRKEVSG